MGRKMQDKLRSELSEADEERQDILRMRERRKERKIRYAENKRKLAEFTQKFSVNEKVECLFSGRTRRGTPIRKWYEAIIKKIAPGRFKTRPIQIKWEDNWKNGELFWKRMEDVRKLEAGR